MLKNPIYILFISPANQAPAVHSDYAIGASLSVIHMLIIGTNLLRWNCKAQSYYIKYATIFYDALRYIDPANVATGVENDPTLKGH